MCCSEYHVGALRVVIAPNADAEKILHHVRSIFLRVSNICADRQTDQSSMSYKSYKERHT